MSFGDLVGQFGLAMAMALVAIAAMGHVILRLYAKREADHDAEVARLIAERDYERAERIRERAEMRAEFQARQATTLEWGEDWKQLATRITTVADRVTESTRAETR